MNRRRAKGQQSADHTGHSTAVPASVDAMTDSNTPSGASTPDSDAPSLPKQIILERAKRPKLNGQGRLSSYT